MIIGLLALSYVGFALLEARLYQAEQARRFERALKETNLARAVSPGIALTTLSGSYRYRVDFTKVVKPEETEVLEDGDGDGDILTLVTCYPFNFVGSSPKRFIVRARRISE